MTEQERNNRLAEILRSSEKAARMRQTPGGRRTGRQRQPVSPGVRLLVEPVLKDQSDIDEKIQNIHYRPAAFDKSNSTGGTHFGWGLFCKVPLYAAGVAALFGTALLTLPTYSYREENR